MTLFARSKAARAQAQQVAAGRFGDRSATPAAAGRVLLIHGYSAQGKDLEPWRKKLAENNIVTLPIEIGNYVTLNNEVTLKDLGEAFERALRRTAFRLQLGPGNENDTWTFDAIVHSTGMLVVRQWLVSDPFAPGDPRSRLRRLKHLVGLAPATWGSPQAKQGRSFIGPIVKGNRHLGPDFLNAGDQVLDGLELGSRFTWQLALRDMVGPTCLYDKGPGTPYAAVFIGNQGWDGVAALDNPPGSDGTVRWAGCALNTRLIQLDLRREPKLVDGKGQPTRLCISPWATQRLPVPMIAVPGQNHGSIVSEPRTEVRDLIGSFLQVTDGQAYDRWEAKAASYGDQGRRAMDAAAGANGAGWQQLVVRMSDQHGDPVRDYNFHLYVGRNLQESLDPAKPPVRITVDTYSGDRSFRCFHIPLTKEMLAVNTGGSSAKRLWMELIAASGTDLIEYFAYTGTPGDPRDLPKGLSVTKGCPQALQFDLTTLTGDADKLLYPYTTTMLEIFLEREPTPLDAPCDIFQFPQPAARRSRLF